MARFDLLKGQERYGSTKNGGEVVAQFKINGIEVWVSVSDREINEKKPRLEVVVEHPSGQKFYYWPNPPRGMKVSESEVKDFLRSKGEHLLSTKNSTGVTK